MALAAAISEVILSLLLPLLVLWAEPRSRLVRFLSPVVVCYALGMLLGNQPWVEFSNPVALWTCNVTVALAIPLLLFSVDLLAWLRLARNTVISFFLVMVAVMLSSTLAHSLFHRRLPDSAGMAGMLVGVYTGGTPNMAAIGTALEVPAEIFIMLNAADMVASFAYLFFLLVLAVRIPRRLLPRTPRAGNDSEAGADAQVDGERGWHWPGGREFLLAGGLAVLIVGAALLAALPAGKGSRQAIVILAITTLAVLASFVPAVRRLRGAHDMGQFLLLVFCVAMGFTTDFGKLFGSSLDVVFFTALTLTGAVVIHFGLSMLLRLDRDTVIITSAAGIFGPHMVGPVTVALKNREVLFSGLASGLVGYAAGNYLGMVLYWLLTRGG